MTDAVLAPVIGDLGEVISRDRPRPVQPRLVRHDVSRRAACRQGHAPGRAQMALCELSLSGRAASWVAACGQRQNPGARPAGSLCWPARTRDDRLVAVTEQSTGDAVPERWNAVGPKSDMWMDPAQDPRFAAGAELEGERATLLDYLRAYRLALELKCAGLDAEQLARRSVPPSTMSLLGLIRHMADVERNWFRRVMAQTDTPPLYWSADVEDADWAGAVADPAVVADAWRAWREEVAFAEQFVAGSPDLAVRSPMHDGT